MILRFLLPFCAVALCGCNRSPEPSTTPLDARTRVAADEVHIIVDLDDKADGLLQLPPSPLLQHADSLADGLEKLRQAREEIPDSAANLWLFGDFEIDAPIHLDAAYNGGAATPTRIRSLPGKARIQAGTAIKAGQWLAVSNATARARISEALRDRIRAFDLKAAGIAAPAFPKIFDDNGGLPELLVDGDRAPLAIYPNRMGALTMEKALRNGDKNTSGIFQYRAEHQDAHARWAKVVDRGLWLKGYWRVAWGNDALRVKTIDPAKRTVEFDVGLNGGIGNKYTRPDGNGQEVYWALNQLEDIDQPGEWCVDFVDQVLYYLPRNEEEQTVLSHRRIPVIHLDQSMHIELIGLHLANSLGNGIQVDGGEQHTIRGCDISMVAESGIHLNGGTQHQVVSCDLSKLGGSGIVAGGGDASQSPRQRADHRITNNHIQRFGIKKRVYAAGVHVGYKARKPAVGMIVSHNLIENCPHVGILFEGYDSLFEHNEIRNFAKVSNDMGGIYSYYDSKTSGNNTIRGNFIHSSLQGDGIYFDNHVRNATVSSNLVYRMAARPDANRGIGILMKNTEKSGQASVLDNLVVDCRTSYQLMNSEAWTISGNTALGGTTKNNVGVDQLDPRPIEAPLRSALAALPGADLLPIKQMGLYPDEHRRSLPAPFLFDPDASGEIDSYDIGDRE